MTESARPRAWRVLHTVCQVGAGLLQVRLCAVAASCLRGVGAQFVLDIDSPFSAARVTTASLVLSPKRKMGTL